MYSEELVLHWFEKENPAGEKMTEAVMEALRSTGLSDGISEIRRFENGMTNHQYFFENEGRFYLLRMPGEGSGYLVNRRNEASVYSLLKEKGITDEVLYINAETGIKITKYMEGVHPCNVNDEEEVQLCMRHLKRFHQMGFEVEHVFDIFHMIREYETECEISGVNLECYSEIRAAVLELKDSIERNQGRSCLSHIDAIADNFLVKEKKAYLIDWEYAAMCDPHIDIAMFCIYAEYGKAETDRTIDAYFETGCNEKVRRKIYAYMSACAYLWVLWSEIKQALGTDFTEYKKGQLCLAKAYYELARKP